MYKAAGMSVKTVDPLPNQTLENFQKHAKARPKSVVVCRSRTFYASIIVKTDPDVGVLFFQTVITSVGYSDVDGSVAAMKAHLEKYIINTKDPNTYLR
jgi:hypothetical protein